MIKGGHSGFVQRYYFTVQHRALDFDCFSDCEAKILEIFHFIALA
jgi:hypothetical protein